MRSRPRSKESSGGAATELALLLPLLGVMLAAAIDLGRVFYDVIGVTSAVRAGVHYGAQSKDASEDIAGMEQVARDELAGLSDVYVLAERFCECSDGKAVDCSAKCNKKTPRIFVKVTAQRTFESLFFYPGIPNQIVLTREAVARAH